MMRGGEQQSVGRNVNLLVLSHQSQKVDLINATLMAREGEEGGEECWTEVDMKH